MSSRAQDLYQKLNRTGKLDSYLVVRIGSKGRAVIEDLVVGGIS
ncbi:MAG TPA: hypothetical protein VKY57_07520 [Chitinispirillaceae bacterium]|nr:hypothetical protein [Chitinispirillaceae bacterium]